MKVYALLYLLVMVLNGIQMSKTDTTSITLDSFQVGKCVGSRYTTPPTGRTTLNLYEENGDIPLHVDYRVNWETFINTLLLSTRTGGTWVSHQNVTGITSPSGTVVEILICANGNGFVLAFNRMQVATYSYPNINNTNIIRFEYENYSSYSSTLKQLSMFFQMVFN